MVVEGKIDEIQSCENSSNVMGEKISFSRGEMVDVYHLNKQFHVTCDSLVHVNQKI